LIETVVIFEKTTKEKAQKGMGMKKGKRKRQRTRRTIIIMAKMWREQGCAKLNAFKKRQRGEERAIQKETTEIETTEKDLSTRGEEVLIRGRLNRMRWKREGGGIRKVVRRGGVKIHRTNIWGITLFLCKMLEQKQRKRESIY